MPHEAHETAEAAVGVEVDKDIGEEHAHEGPEDCDEETHPARRPEQINEETESIGDVGVDRGGILGDEVSEDGALPKADERAV